VNSALKRRSHRVRCRTDCDAAVNRVLIFTATFRIGPGVNASVCYDGARTWPAPVNVRRRAAPYSAVRCRTSPDMVRTRL